jgi:uncharacterized membrane protein
MASPAGVMMVNSRPLVSAGTVLGIGMGGFFDGILFHQILQVHNMLSARLPKTTIPNIEVNMFWDGLFHAVTWTMTAVGLWMLFRAARRTEVPWSERIFGGAILLGWGLFNLVEGVIDHHILQVHHVYEAAGLSLWDYLFLGSGAAFIALGWSCIRSAQPAVPTRVARGPLPHTR